MSQNTDSNPAGKKKSLSSWLWHPDHAALRDCPGIPCFWRHLSQSIPLRRLYFCFVSLLFGLKVRGFEHVPRNRACIFISNHGSHYDGFFLYAAISRLDSRSLVPVAWYCMLDYPIIGPILKCVRAVPVDQEPSRMMLRTDIMRTMINHLLEGRSLMIMPEGHRSDTLDRFHSGGAMVALETGAPLVPVSLRGVQPLFKHLNRIPRFWGRVELVFHPPLHTDAAEGLKGEDAAALLMKKARTLVASAIDYSDGQK